MSSQPRSWAGGPTTEIVAAIFHSIERAERAAFVTPSRSVSWAEWIGSVEQMVERSDRLRGARTGLCLRPSEKSYALLMALSRLNCDVFLHDAGMSSAALQEFAEQYRLDATIDPSGDRDAGELSSPLQSITCSFLLASEEGLKTVAQFQVDPFSRFETAGMDEVAPLVRRTAR
jgi:hypothetical protein